MAHLSIHGIPIECSASDWEPAELGELVRSLNGAPRSTKRVKKREHRFTTDVGGMLLEEAEAVRALIAGEGHSWSFEGVELYSSRKLLPSSQSATNISTGIVAGKHGAALFAEDASHVEWPLGYTEWWTLLFWRKVAATWRHYVVRGNFGLSQFNAWENGVQTDVDPEILYITTDGDLVLDCNQGDETLDEMVALPYYVPDSWPALLYSYHQNNTWGALPFVKASGPGVPGTGLTALGEAYMGRRVPMREEDGTFTTGEVFDFKLMGT